MSEVELWPDSIAALEVGGQLDILCDCGVPEGLSVATDPNDRTVVLPHQHDCPSVDAWKALADWRADLNQARADLAAARAKLAELRGDVSVQVDHLELAAKQIREQGDVQQVLLLDDGVSQTFSLANELEMIVIILRAALNSTVTTTPTADDERGEGDD